MLTAVLFAAGCSSSSNTPPPVPPADENTPPPDPTFALQIVHASSNAPTVNVSVGSNTAGLSDIDFKESRTARSYAPGNYTVTVDANLPDDGNLPGVLEVVSDFAADTFYTVLAVGNVGNETQGLDEIVIARSGDIPAGDVVPTIIHAAVGVGPVNVYVTDPGVADADLGNMMNPPVNGATPIAYGDDPLTLSAIPEDTYRVRVVPDGGTDVVFDSGVVEVAGGTDPVLVAINNTNAGSDSPISVLVVGRLQFIEIQDEDTQAEVRVVHTISDLTTPVNVVIDGDVAIPGLEFQDVAPDQVPGGNGVLLDADDYVIQVFVGATCAINCGDDTTDPATDPDETTLDAGVFYDAIAQGLTVAPAEGEDADPPADLVYEADDRRRVALFTKLRLIHSAGTVGDVDIYIVAPGATIADVDPDFEDIPFGANTGYAGLAPNQAYDVVVTATGSKEEALRASTGELAGQGIYTAIVVAGPAAILLDDFTTAE